MTYRTSSFLLLTVCLLAFFSCKKDDDSTAGTASNLQFQFKFDPAKLSTNTLVADAVAALQNAALSGGMQLGPVRETASRGSARELATVQMEGVGPVPAVLGFLDGMGSLGFPLVAESVQFSADRNQPGAAKLTVTVVILNVEQARGTMRRPDA